MKPRLVGRMKINLGFMVSKVLRAINRPALRNCQVDKSATVGTGSNCIGTTIGRYSYLGKNTSVVDADIGSFCSIASYCAIGGEGHEVGFVSTSPVFLAGRNALKTNFAALEGTDKRGRVQINDDVWIGEAVYIRDGVKIGTGAVIGAHSVVTKDVEPYSIVAGAPAKHIRFRFDHETITKLAATQWWNWNENKLNKYGEYFRSPIDLLNALEGKSQ